MRTRDLKDLVDLYHKFIISWNEELDGKPEWTDFFEWIQENVLEGGGES